MTVTAADTGAISLAGDPFFANTSAETWTDVSTTTNGTTVTPRA